MMSMSARATRGALLRDDASERYAIIVERAERYVDMSYISDADEGRR